LYLRRLPGPVAPGLVRTDFQFQIHVDMAIRFKDANPVNVAIVKNRDRFLKQGTADKLQPPAEALTFK
jgi:hypothetical protein